MIQSERPRPLSLDVFQGLSILALIFVNGLAGVRGLPPWMRHGPAFRDGQALVDLVVPLFVFAVGMGLPFALRGREASWPRVLGRVAGMLFLGLLEINGERMVAGPWMTPEVWRILEAAGILLVWNGSRNPAISRRLRLGGWAVLALCVLLYPRGNVGGPLVLRPGWWGIPGLLGWTYLAGCGVYLGGRRRSLSVAGGLALFLGLAGFMGGALLVKFPILAQVENPLSTCLPLTAIMLAGAFLGLLLAKEASRGDRAGWVATYGAALLLASHLLLPREPLGDLLAIGQELGTVAWCLRASAFGAILWLGVHFLVDWTERHPGAEILGGAGRNALLAYFLAPAALALAALLGQAAGHPGFLDLLGETLGGGLLRAALPALALTALAGFLGRRGIHLGPDLGI